jgi:hypothetical protein
MKCWLGVVSKEHVMRGVAGNYVQVCHGKGGPLQRMKQGDWFVYYSPVVTFGGKDKLQAFTAMGVVRSGKVYQFEMSRDFKPFRCDVDFKPCKEVLISTLKSQLSITQGNWGMMFRRGHFEVPLADFQKIAAAMEVKFGEEIQIGSSEKNEKSNFLSKKRSHESVFFNADDSEKSNKTNKKESTQSSKKKQSQR